MNRVNNPHARQMGDESMIRNSAYRASAIWPQEQSLFDRYDLSGPIRILDLGCGTGEITRRLAEKYAQATIVGIDILETNLMVARLNGASPDSDRVSYEQGDAFSLDCPAESFDLVACRHLSQSVPDFPQVLYEIMRVLKPGGWLHLLSEDYGMLHMPTMVRDGRRFDPDRFWSNNAVAYMRQSGCDGQIGRHSPAMLERAEYDEIAIDYIVVDTLRVDRKMFGGILRAWRDGFAGVVADATLQETSRVVADFNWIIKTVETPPNYAVWHVPVISGRKPGRT